MNRPLFRVGDYKGERERERERERGGGRRERERFNLIVARDKLVLGH